MVLKPVPSGLAPLRLPAEGLPDPAELAALAARLAGLGYAPAALAGLLQAGITRRGLAAALIAAQRGAPRRPNLPAPGGRS